MTNTVYKPEPMRAQQAIRADILALEQVTEVRLDRDPGRRFVSP